VQPRLATFGKTAVGALSGAFPANHKWVNRYALSVAGSLTKLSIYLAPTSTSGQQLLKGLLYADSGGAPGELLGASQQLIFKHSNAAGWYELPFAVPVSVPAGNYWIGLITSGQGKVAGYRYDRVSRSRDGNANPYASGPSNPFDAVTVDAQQMSLYATYSY